MSRTKYTLVERADTVALAVPTAILQDVLDSGEYGTAPLKGCTPISMAEIKRRGGIFTLTETQFRADMERRARLEAYEAYRARYHGVVTDAEVLSWDHSRGEGLVRLADGSARDIYACNLPGRKTLYPETACVFYMPGETVQVKLDIHYTRTFVLGVSQAYIDNEKWDRIKDQPLAFRCDDEGRAVTGLFAAGAGL